jgi:hypothetical protein
MTSAEYRKALDRLGLSIVGAAPVLGIGRRHSQRIAAGETPVSGPISRLLSLLLKYGIPKEWKGKD